jgi:hypothetical protein
LLLIQSNIQLNLINEKSIKILQFIIHTALQNKFMYAQEGRADDVNHTSEQILNALNNKYFKRPNKKVQ